jgi:hypothetical protein
MTTVSAQGWPCPYLPGGSEHLLVGHVAGQHGPAAQVHEADEFEDIECWKTRGEEGPHPGARRKVSLLSSVPGL